jgi:hypothetical protein
MASRKQHAQKREPRNGEPVSRNDERDQGNGSAAPVAQQKPDAPSGQTKSPNRYMAVLWGIPLLLFIIIAVCKECI